MLIVLNRAPMDWCSKQKLSVEESTFSAELCAMKVAMEMLEGIRCKLRMLGMPIDGHASTHCDNEAVHTNTLIPEATLKNNHYCIFLQPMSGSSGRQDYESFEAGHYTQSS